MTQAISTPQPIVNWKSSVQIQPTETSIAPQAYVGVHASVQPPTIALAPSVKAALPVSEVTPPVQETTWQQPLARRPSSDCNSNVMKSSDVANEEKRFLKRTANRRSAQMSRERKKRLIEELKEENDKLRHEEQILHSISDFIVVFDSSGKMLFVSHSVKRLLNYSRCELEGRSFWERLCDKSVRILKAAFMNAMATRIKGSDMVPRGEDFDTVPLGSGMLELRLLDRDSTYKVVTLNGVVNFSGKDPECVCSIRPVETIKNHAYTIQEPVKKKIRLASSASGNIASTMMSKRSSSPNLYFQPNLVRDATKLQQSVLGIGSSDTASVKITRGKAKARRRTTITAPVTGAQISDNESVR